MSFGFSVGDFITVGRLVQHIVSSLRASSITEYRELILELHGFQRALHEIEHLKCHPSQEPAVSGIKVAALMCQYPPDEFAGKLKRFESLDSSKAGHASQLVRVSVWGKRLRWGFCMEEEVMKVRAYLVAHVGSLNMRLITEGLASASFLAEQNQKGHESLETRVEKFYMELVSMRHDLQANRSLARSSNSILTRLSGLITGDMFSQLKTLVDLAGKVWQSNMQIMSFFVNLQTSSPSPELRYTWVQEPIKFEDAMGRVIPIPSEYNWGKLEAIIMAQFDNGPGYKKICAGEYELFNTLDCSQIISRAENEVLTPGLSITMAIIVGRYHSAKSDRCPRPGCKSEEFASKESGGTICCICKACFDHAQKSLPLPLRPPEQDFVTFVPYSQRSQGLKRKRFSVLTDGEIEPQHHRKKMKIEGNMFKNFRTQLSTLAQSPIVSNVRSTGRRLKRHKSTNFQATRKASSRQQPAPQQDSAKQYASNSPGTIPNWLEGTSSLHCRPYLLASSDQGKNEEHDPASSFQYSASNRKDPIFSTAPTVVSEPSWLAMFDLESVCFARTASPKLGRLESQVEVYPARFSKPRLSASQSSFISYVRTQMAEHDGMRSPGPQSQRSD